MKGILKLYSQYGDKIIIIPVLCIILCMVTYFIHIITKKSRFPKYLPGLAFIIFGIFKFKSGITTLSPYDFLTWRNSIAVFIIIAPLYNYTALPEC